jgi:P4 family phage/plasmid primase-like protien
MATSTKKAPSINLEEYLKLHTASKGETITHTRIGDKDKGIYGGAYHIDSAEWSEFMAKYYQNVFVNGKLEYLTEKQSIENGPIMIDIDLRYETSITKKQHTSSHIIDIVMLYADKIEELVELENGKKVEVFVMEKSDVNILDTKTKDGIHIIIGIKMHKAQQVMLRKRVLVDLKHMWDDLPITNTWEDVLDDGVTRAFCNWQMYGSRKPGNQAYLIKKHFQLNRIDNSWDIEEKEITTFSTEKNIEKLSARYTGYESYGLKEKYIKEFEETKETLGKREALPNNGASNKGKYTLKILPDTKPAYSGIMGNTVEYNDITNEEILDQRLEELFVDTGVCNYIVKETHQYTMSLPESYYGAGSYNKWIRVGWALANTNSKMFLTWIKFSSQGPDFKWKDSIKEMHDMWTKFECNNPDGLTNRSIMYWSRTDAPSKYEKIQNETIGFFVEQAIKETTEYDIARVLFHMYKDTFICVSVKHDVWYKYTNNRWFDDSAGGTLRSHISREMHQIFMNKSIEYTAIINTYETTDPRHDKMSKDISKLGDISINLKRSVWKNNIMREARELFYYNDFIEQLDKNPHLMCFNNGVMDFQNKVFRKGQHDDYLSKCTKIDYVPFNEKAMAPYFEEIKAFMTELFPVKELHDYMWEHLASCLIGTNKNQTFNIYYGGGRNGKSKLTELMSLALGQYKATVPITLITQKRNTIGSTSSEVVQLMGVRYAVMQEPSKGDRINEGIMKEITAGDPIQGRALFKDTVTFVPQFKLVVCTNELFEDMSTDDGTWRRIRICDYMSKFLEKPYEDEKFPKNEYPYQYKLDKDIDKKFKDWAPVFMSYLVKLACELQGNVRDCRMVLASSDKYRNNQDYLADFAKDKLRIKEGDKIKKPYLLEQFREWYISNHGRTKIPKGKEIHEYMDKKFGAYKNGGWKNVSLIVDDEEEEE